MERRLLEGALAALSRHHDALRLRYVRDTGGVASVLLDVRGSRATQMDRSHASPGSRAGAVDRDGGGTTQASP